MVSVVQCHWPAHCSWGNKGNCMNDSTKPIPSPTAATKAFWSGCADRKLFFRKCTQCAKFHAPTRYACSCGSTDLSWTEMSGSGTVFSYTIVHRAPDPAFKNDLPYVIAIIEMDEGGRLMSNVIDCDPNSVVIGMSVQAVFEIVSEGIGVPKFRPQTVKAID